MTQRILSISGLRGIVGDGLDPAYVAEFAAGVGTWADGGTVVVARDGRVTGPLLKRAVLAGLTSVGCRVLDADIAATPTCGVLVDHHAAAAGIEITASHNPVEWNGLKPFGPDGSVFNAENGRQLIEILNDRRFNYQSWDGIGEVQSLQNAGDVHLQRVLRLIDTAAIRSRRFLAVLDCNHGAGGVLGPLLLERLGCKAVVLGKTPDGRFGHPPEPLEQNLGGLCDAVRSHNADIGFAQDPDADRLAIVDERGEYVGEELTLALCADHVLGTRPGPVVVNASTSRTTADVAAKYDCPFHRSNVGEANVVAKMREVSAELG
ncbi:MAG: phosphoglucosamine mutase, partial [Planctomycetaceae bacterium]